MTNQAISESYTKESFIEASLHYYYNSSDSSSDKLELSVIVPHFQKFTDAIKDSLVLVWRHSDRDLKHRLGRYSVRYQHLGMLKVLLRTLKNDPEYCDVEARAVFLNSLNREGTYSLLMEAVNSCNAASARMLIKAGANPYQAHSFHFTPMLLAKFHGHKAMQAVLEKSPYTLSRKRSVLSAFLEEAAINYMLMCVFCGIDIPLSYESLFGPYNYLARQLVKYGKKLSAISPHEQTALLDALHFASGPVKPETLLARLQLGNLTIIPTGDLAHASGLAVLEPTGAFKDVRLCVICDRSHRPPLFPFLMDISRLKIEHLKVLLEAPFLDNAEGKTFTNFLYSDLPRWVGAQYPTDLQQTLKGSLIACFALVMPKEPSEGTCTGASAKATFFGATYLQRIGGGGSANVELHHTLKSFFTFLREDLVQRCEEFPIERNAVALARNKLDRRKTKYELRQVLGPSFLPFLSLICDFSFGYKVGKVEDLDFVTDHIESEQPAKRRKV